MRINGRVYGILLCCISTIAQRIAGKLWQKCTINTAISNKKRFFALSLAYALDNNFSPII